MNDEIIRLFGIEFNQEARLQSYDYIENFIEQNVQNWNEAPDTDSIESTFTNELKNFSDSELAFLLIHSGYIPEFYSHDSSQETLYSKLVESLVCEWAIRIGFTDSYLQKQKSNKEDITIKYGNNIIVCDAKSFRLGRSQAAPNVKDTIKQASYKTWLEAYENNECRSGLITFPSLMDWKKGSEAYKYFTDSSLPILFLFYEHLSYILLFSDSFRDFIITKLNSYDEIFPVITSERQIYIDNINLHLFSHPDNKLYDDFWKLADIIIKEKIKHSIERIETKAVDIKNEIIEHIDDLAEEEIKQIAIDATFMNKYGQTLKQLENIKKFRPT